MRGVFLLMFVVAVMGASGHYLVRTLHGERSFQLAFILFTIASPLLAMVGVSVFLALIRRRR
jgi:hypothetical protein